MDDIKIKKAIHRRIETINKVIKSNQYEYKKKMVKLSRNFNTLTNDEIEALEDMDFVKVRHNVKLKL